MHPAQSGSASIWLPISRNYDLPDHRGEEAYASYTQMEKQYDRIVNEKIKEIRE